MLNLSERLKLMTGKKPLKADKPAPDKPYYVYSGPMDTREKDNWVDIEAHAKKEQKADTGSIHIKHPDIEMLCRVTDQPTMPGFLITVKDREGSVREFHVYLSRFNNSLMICSSNQTDAFLGKDDRIRKSYPIPFVDTNPYNSYPLSCADPKEMQRCIDAGSRKKKG